MQSTPTPKQVAVVGAGIAGLTTAFKLRQRGHEVFIYEAGDRVGGQISTLRREGFLIEHGPHTLLGRGALPDLVDELGLKGQTLYASDEANKRFVVRDGRPQPVPTGPKDFLKTDLLSTKAKLRLLAEPLVPAARVSDETLADFITRRLGEEVLDYAVGPMVAGTFAGEARKLSARYAFPKLYRLAREHGSLTRGMISRLFERLGNPDRERKSRAKLLSFVGGAQVLTDALGAHLEDAVELGAEVYRVDARGGRWTLRFRQTDKRRQKTVDEIVLTAPAYRLADIRLGVDSPPTSLEVLADVYYAPVSIVALGFRREDVAHPLDGFGMLLPRNEESTILGTLFMSSLFDGRAPEGHVLLTSFVGGARQPELASEPSEALVDATVADLDDLLGLRGEPVFQEHIAWERAIPQYDVGYGAFDELMDRVEQNHDGLHFAGSYRNGIAVPDLVTAGFELADRISEE